MHNQNVRLPTKTLLKFIISKCTCNHQGHQALIFFFNAEWRAVVSFFEIEYVLPVTVVIF